MRGILNIDSEFAQKIGFTSDKFRGYSWCDERRILISAIMAIHPRQGHFTQLIKNIEDTGLRVAVSTPLSPMSNYLAKRNFVPHWEYDINLEKVEVWERSPAWVGVERQPCCGEKWQHFKGNEYQVLSVSNSVWIPSTLVNYWAMDTESEQTLAVYLHDYGTTLTKGDGMEAISIPHVIYFSPLNLSKVWARKLDNFLKILGDKNKEVTTNYYRFQKVDRA